jgi:hypothetical protein
VSPEEAGDVEAHERIAVGLANHVSCSPYRVLVARLAVRAAAIAYHPLPGYGVITAYWYCPLSLLL